MGFICFRGNRLHANRGKLNVIEEVSWNLSPEHLQKFDLYLISKQNFSHLISLSSDKNPITQSNAVVLYFDEQGSSSSSGSREYEACFVENGAWVLNRSAKILRVPMGNRCLRNTKIGMLKKTPDNIDVIRSAFVLKNDYFGIVEDQKQYQEAEAITAFDQYVDNAVSPLEELPKGYTLKEEIKYWEKTIEQYEKECLEEQICYKKFLTVYQGEVSRLKILNAELLKIKEEINTFNNDTKKFTGFIDYNNDLIANLVPVMNQQTFSSADFYSVLGSSAVYSVVENTVKSAIGACTITTKMHPLVQAAVMGGVVIGGVFEAASVFKASTETAREEESHCVKTAEQFEHLITFFKKLIAEIQYRFEMMPETLSSISKNLKICKGSIKKLTLKQTEIQQCSNVESNNDLLLLASLKSTAHRLKQTSKQYKQATATFTMAIDKMRLKLSRLLEQRNRILAKQSHLSRLHAQMSEAYKTCAGSYGQLYATQAPSLQTFYSNTKNSSQELIQLLLEFDELSRRINVFIRKDLDSDEKHSGSIVDLIHCFDPECRKLINDITQMIPNIVDARARSMIADTFAGFEDNMSSMLNFYINSFRQLISSLRADNTGETVGLGSDIVRRIFLDVQYLSELESAFLTSKRLFVVKFASHRDQTTTSMLTLLSKDVGSEVVCSVHLTQYALQSVSASSSSNVAVVTAEEQPVVLHNATIDSTKELSRLAELYALYKQDKTNVENTYKVAECLHSLGEIERCLFYLNICTNNKGAGDYAKAAYKLKINILTQKGELHAAQSELENLLAFLTPGTEEYQSIIRLKQKIENPKTQSVNGM